MAVDALIDAADSVGQGVLLLLELLLGVGICNDAEVIEFLENAKNLETLNVDLGLIADIDELLVLLDPLESLSDDCNDEVEQNDHHDESRHIPQSP